jgi:hypothetical protein
MSNADVRLGRNGVDEIKAHPFLRDVNWVRARLNAPRPGSLLLWMLLRVCQDTLLQQDAPFRSPLARVLGVTMDTLKGMKTEDPRFPGLVETLTGNFDKFPDVKLDADHGASSAADGKRKPKSEKFIGYTFRRSKDGSGPVLTSGEASSKPRSGITLTKRTTTAPASAASSVTSTGSDC